MRIVPAATLVIVGLVLTLAGPTDDQGRWRPGFMALFEGDWFALFGPVALLLGGLSLYRRFR